MALIVAGTGFGTATALDSQPPSLLYWTGCGALVGLSVALYREINRRTITTASSIARHRGYVLLGAAPELPEETLRALPPQHRGLLGAIAFAPASPFATAFRDLQGVLQGDRIVAFIAAASDEGSSTVAMCAAASAALQGRRVILIDGDLRRRSLTESLRLEADAGVMEATLQPESWRDIVSQEPETGFALLPASRRGARAPLSKAPGWPHLLNELCEDYDLVLIDCPPALANAEACALAACADRTVVVAAWDRTPIAALRQTMKLILAQAKVKTGVFVNRVPEGRRFGRLRPG
jgi:Mrp family chromosome partitioning ATPase